MSKVNPNNRRVVVTGLGVVSSLGIGWQEFWKNLLAGKSGISKITAFDTSQYDRHYGGEVKNFDPTKFMSKGRAATIGRSSQLAIAASKLALKDARLNQKKISNLKIGTCLGTTMGEGRIIEGIVEGYVRKDKVSVENILALSYPANSIIFNLAAELKIHGRNILFVNACAAGNYAVGYASDLIRSGRADYMLAGGVDSLSRIAFTGFGRIFAMAPERCQPFDKNRQGMIVGEGGAIILLESLENARKRKAPIYAEILGYGMSCDAYSMTEPSVKGIVKAFQKSLENSRVDTNQIDYISAHGTGTIENDEAECRAYKKIFGRGLQKIPISSIKSMIGHTMGAASAFETIACCLAIKDNKIPPTINYERNDPQCEIDCVPNKGRKHNIRIAFNNSQAFGGNNACLVLKRI